MTKRMLIDATHAEETRVVILDGNRLEDFDIETAAKKQLKGNIYLAKVVRVEPSLQAAFVEYGGGRHGFLAFGEIHPDYYQIPVADRQRLLELQEADARAEEEAEDAAAAAAEAAENAPQSAGPESDEDDKSRETPGVYEADEPPLPLEERPAQTSQAAAIAQDFIVAREEAVASDLGSDLLPEPPAEEARGEPASREDAQPVEPEASGELFPAEASTSHVEELPPAPPPEELGGADVVTAEGADLLAREDENEGGDLAEAGEDHGYEQHTGHDESGQDDEDAAEDENGGRSSERREARPPARYMRSYKIQEVIRRRQILLVQVVKEERGTKGAALTTFISLAGRFSVLMPNSPRGGGISRKITSAADRRRLKEVTAELQIPRGMGLIVRTAGANRPKAEIKRDCEYLLELWDSIRETTMASIAPALIHEEASLIKRSIRDNYSRDVDEVLVDGEAGWRAARDFMRMLMPAHARKVILWTEPQPLFARNTVEAQLDGMLQPTVQLRSGGYLVINQTEALVAIDVNSGRSTRERGIEETALKTNLEAADEVARQLRLRDLAGLIVIDFIDMESRRNNAAVEKRLKDALRDDRARIQVGSISHFGLLELSRQRLRPSLAETNFTICPHCGGSGHVRTTETAALAVLRAVEEEGAKRRAAAIVVHVAGAVALYVLNHKRVRLAEIEQRYAMSVAFAADESLLPPQTRIERVRPQIAGELPPPAAAIPMAARPMEDDDAVEEADVRGDEEDETDTEAAVENGLEAGADVPVAGETAEEAETRRRKRRRRRRGGRREDGPAAQASSPPGVDPAAADQPDLGFGPPAVTPDLESELASASEEGTAVPNPDAPAAEASGDEDARGRRRGRRGGRRRRRDPADGEAPAEGSAEEPASFEQSPAPVYAGPTPADPFGGQAFDIFDMMDEHEQRAAAPEPAPEPATPPAPAPNVVEPVEAEAAPGPAPVAALAEDHSPAIVAEEPPLMNGHAAPAAAPAPEPAPEPVSSPVPPPVIVGSEPAAEKKRGWWRR